MIAMLELTILALITIFAVAAGQPNDHMWQSIDERSLDSNAQRLGVKVIIMLKLQNKERSR